MRTTGLLFASSGRLQLLWRTEIMLRWNTQPELHLLSLGIEGATAMEGMMKAVIIAMLALAPSAVFAQSSHYVAGHVTRSGDYVAPHYQTNSDSTRLNNWSSQGNVNPYTGRAGTADPYRVDRTHPTGSPYNSGYGNDPN